MTPSRIAYALTLAVFMALSLYQSRLLREADSSLNNASGTVVELRNTLRLCYQHGRFP